MKTNLKDVTELHWYLMSNKKDKVNVVDFLKDFLEQYPMANIIVGTDSQERGRKTTYVTAIIAEYPNNRGSRVIYTKEIIRSFDNSWSRLSAEAIRTLEVATYLAKNNVIVTHVELDYQDGGNMPKDYLTTVSRPIYDSYKGLFAEIGCQVSGKLQPPTDENVHNENITKKYKILGAIAAADKLSK